MRGKRPGEIERLQEGLARAGEDWLPETIEAELEPKSPEDLLRLTDYGDRLEDAVKIRNGWLYIMLRRKVGHGNFQKYLEDHNRSYWKARDCMNYARASARHPALAGALAGRALRHILTLPEPEVYKLEEAITGIPAGEAKKITRSWIEGEYRNIQNEKKARGRSRRDLSQKERAKEERVISSQREGGALDEAYRAAILALRNAIAASESVGRALKRLIEVVDPQHDNKKIFNPDHPLLPDLGGPFEKLKDVVKEIEGQLERLAARARGVMLP